MPITSLYLTDFGPFDEIEFEFDRQVNVFTGPNNSGKSAALLMLGELLVYPFTTPDKLYRSDRPEWKLRYSSGTKVESVGGDLPCDPQIVASDLRSHWPHLFPPRTTIRDRFSRIRTLCESGRRSACREDSEHACPGTSKAAEETRFRSTARRHAADADEECGTSGIETAQ